MALITAAVSCFGAYLIALTVYRLCLSPLAKFPGPKLAALSKWYEAYYEIVLNGKFTFHIDDLHAKYGPIVRITPEEVHIKDSAFWDTLFVKNPKASKYEWSASRFGNNSSMFTTSDAAHHRLRRAPLNAMFSRRAIIEFQSIIQDKVKLLSEGFQRCKEKGSVFNVLDAYSAFGGDVIMMYSFGFDYQHLQSDCFQDNLHSAYMAMSRFGHTVLQFPWMNPLFKSLPDSLNSRMNPPLGKMLRLQRDLRQTIINIKENPKSDDSDHSTIFHTILQSDMPEPEKSTTRLTEEAQTVVGAGIETTAWALANATFYILSNSEVLSKLRSELWLAIPDPSAPGAFDYEKLEKLPYLRGCARESVRFSLGISGRNPRVLHEPLVYKDGAIPPESAISMSIRDVNFDAEIFEDPNRYKPERWADGASKLPDESSLDSHLVSFGKGPRSCLGTNLAWMELFVVLATIFRRFSLELYETDISDVRLAHDFFLPSPKLDSKGVRVRVVGVET